MASINEQIVGRVNPAVTEDRNMSSDSSPLVSDRGNINTDFITYNRYSGNGTTSNCHCDVCVEPDYCLKRVKAADNIHFLDMDCLGLDAKTYSMRSMFASEGDTLEDIIEYLDTPIGTSIPTRTSMNTTMRRHREIRAQIESLPTPCGCPSPDMDITIGPGDDVLHMAWPTLYEPTSVNYHPEVMVFTDEGYIKSDECFCDANSIDCVPCSPLQVLRGLFPPTCITTEEFENALMANPHFGYKLYEMNEYDLDEFGSPDHYYNSWCISYCGPRVQRAWWHMQTRYDGCVCCHCQINVTGLYSRLLIDTPKVFLPWTSVGTMDMMRHMKPLPLGKAAFYTMVQKLDLDCKTFHNMAKFYLAKHFVPWGCMLPMFLDSASKVEATHKLMKWPETLVEARMQRDTDAVEETATVNRASGNVTISDTTDPSVSEVAQTVFSIPPLMNDLTVDFSTLSDRWCKVAGFTWSGGNAFGAVTHRYDMPIHMISNSECASNTLGFRQYAYFKCDMELEFQVNSNPAQSGCIIMAVMYNGSSDTSVGSKTSHVASLVQMPHVRLMAGASNSGKIAVPWVYQYPMGTTRLTICMRAQYYYTIYIGILSPLRTGSGGPSDCHCVIMGRMTNTLFAGQRAIRPLYVGETVVAEARMLGAGAMASAGSMATVATSIANLVGGVRSKNIDRVESELRKVFEAVDCDRPQDMKEPANMYLQQNTSLSLGTGTQPLKSLQLQAECFTSQPIGMVPRDNLFSTSKIVQVFGLRRHFTWATNQASGVQLATMAHFPIDAFVIPSGAVFPPVSFMAGLYAGWAGDMLLRFTFMVSKFHSGRVWIVYIPDLSPTVAISLPTCYKGVLVDVQTQSTFTMTVPFQFPMMYAPTRQNFRELLPQSTENSLTAGFRTAPGVGSIRVIIETPLRAMQSASPTIDVIIEMAGAENFQLVYPIGTTWHTLNEPAITTARMDRARQQEVTPSGAASPADDVRTAVVTVEPPLSTIVPLWAVNANESFDVKDVCKRYLPWIHLRGAVHSAYYADRAQFTPETVRDAYITVYHIPTFSMDATGVPPIVTPTWLPVILGVPLNMRTHQIARERINLRTNMTMSFRVPWTAPVTMLANGLDAHSGPNQIVAYANGRLRIVVQFNISYVEPGQQDYEPVACYVDLDMSAGYATRRVGSASSNFNFGTMMEAMHDGFRFYRGGFNFQLDVTPIRQASNQHSDLAIQLFRAMDDGGAFYCFQGFPPYSQSTGTGVNLTNAVAVPRPTEAEHWWYPGWPEAPEENQERNVKDLTADGDVEANPGPTDPDMSPGPPLEDYMTADECMDLAEDRAKEGTVKKLVRYFGSVNKGADELLRWVGLNKVTLGRMARSTAGFMVHPQFGQAIMMNDLMRAVETPLYKSMEMLNTTSLAATTTARDVSDAAKEATGLVSDMRKWVDDMASKVNSILDGCGMMERGFDIALAIMNIYNSNGIIMTLLNIVQLFQKLGLKCLQLASDWMSGTEARVTGADEPKATSWASLFVTSILTTFGVAVSGKTWMSAIQSEAVNFFRSGVSVKRFLEVHFDVLGDIVDWVRVNVLGGSYIPDEETMTAKMLAWMHEVNLYAETYAYDKVVLDPTLGSRVFELQTQANQFDLQYTSTNSSPPRVYFQYKRKLQGLVDLLGKCGKTARVRPTPFCVWFHGPPGVGKSRVADSVAIELGKALGVVAEDPIYVRTDETEYWNSYRQQPLIMYPDYARNQTCPEYVKQINEFMSLVDCWPFNPPFAELEDKRRMIQAVGVVVCSNFAFPNVTNVGTVAPAAFYRRRHMVITVRIKQSVIDEMVALGVDITGAGEGEPLFLAEKIPKEWFDSHQAFEHLEFGVYNERMNVSSEVTWFNYTDFIADMTSRATVHRAREQAFVEKTYNIYSALAPESWAERVPDLPDQLREEAARRTQARADREDIRSLKTYRSPIIESLSEAVAFFNVQHINIVSDGGAGPSGGLTLACGCQVWRVGETANVSLCEDCIPRAHPFQKVEKDSRDELDPTVEGSTPCWTYDKIIPNCPILQDPSVVSWMRESPSLPAGYLYWNDVCSHCCHKSEILQYAIFEVVNGKVECVVRTDSYAFILPAYCIQSRMSYLFKIGAPQGPIELPEGALPIELGCLALTCGTIVPPHRRLFSFDRDVLGIFLAGYHTVSNPESVCLLLNQHLTSIYGRNSDSFSRPVSLQEHSRSVLDTYFYWKQKGTTFTERAEPAVRSAARTLLGSLMGLSLVVATVYGGYRLYKSYKEASEVYGEMSKYSNDGARTKNKPFEFSRPSTQVIGRGHFEVICERVRSNTIELRKGDCTIEGVRIAGAFVICPRHLMTADGMLSYKLWVNGSESEYRDVGENVPFVDFQDSKGVLDLCMFKIPELPASKNIVGMFVSEREAIRIKSESEVMCAQGGNLTRLGVRIEPALEVQAYSNIGGTRYSFTGWKFRSNTVSLRCGALLVSNGMFIGMYVSDEKLRSVGSCVAISREMLSNGLNTLGANRFEMKVSGPDEPESAEGPVILPIPEGARFVAIAKAADPITYSGKTCWAPSSIQGDLSPVNRVPAEQSGEMKGKGLAYDVVARGCMKQWRPPKPLDPVAVKQVQDYIVDRLVIGSPPIVVTYPDPLDIYTAFAGIDGISQMGSLNLNTAIGYPLMRQFPSGWKKKNVVEVDRDHQVLQLDKRILADYQLQHSKRVKAELADTTFMDFPKDELLKPGKDTRLINGAPLHHTIDSRRYLMEFFAAIATVDNKIAVGVDAHSKGWGELSDAMPTFINEDYKAFGPGFHAEWIGVVEEAAVAWTRAYKSTYPEYENVVRSLFWELKCARHIAGDLVYRTQCGSPSGAYGTDKINSVANLCYHAYSYLKFNGTLEGFWKEKLIVYGDDTMRIPEGRSFEDFRQCMEEIGITVEIDKSGEERFLKRMFVPTTFLGQRVVLAPLPRAIIGDIMNWVRTPYFSEEEAIRQKVGSYLSEFFHHGESEFDSARESLRKALAQRKIDVEMKVWRDLFLSNYG